MKIAFDYQIFNIQKYGGISRYIFNLYTHIQKQPEHHTVLPMLYTDNYYGAGLSKANFLKWYFKNKFNRAARWNKRFAKFLGYYNDCDVFHPSYYDPYFISSLKKPCVITVHDMIHEKFPEYFADAHIITEQKKKCTHRAEKIIAISESTKNDLISLFHIHPDKIEVVYHGIETEKHIITDDQFSFPLAENYFLFVGERAAYKNFLPFVSALSSLLSENPNIKLICAGGGHFTTEESKTLKSLSISHQVIQVSATDAQLNYLYQNALCFIFPSLYEGFGLPILEAFRNQCPIVVANASCFPEIVENAGLYFDPYQPESLIPQLKALLHNPQLRHELVMEGKKRLAYFDLQNCINQTLEVYQKAIALHEEK